MRILAAATILLLAHSVAAAITIEITPPNPTTLDSIGISVHQGLGCPLAGVLSVTQVGNNIEVRFIPAVCTPQPPGSPTFIGRLPAGDYTVSAINDHFNTVEATTSFTVVSAPDIPAFDWRVLAILAMAIAAIGCLTIRS